MEIVWQTPANPPERHDYIFCNGKKKKFKYVKESGTPVNFLFLDFGSAGIRYVRPYYFEFISHVCMVIFWLSLVVEM